jgi:hypothetical protein
VCVRERERERRRTVKSEIGRNRRALPALSRLCNSNQKRRSAASERVGRMSGSCFVLPQCAQTRVPGRQRHTSTSRFRRISTSSRRCATSRSRSAVLGSCSAWPRRRMPGTACPPLSHTPCATSASQRAGAHRRLILGGAWARACKSLECFQKWPTRL